MTTIIHIDVTDLRVQYDQTEVLHGVTFEVPAGQFLAVVGRSGCGKSTLLHALAGFIPSAGAVTVPGDVGFVFQSYAVFPWLTARGNIEVGLHGIAKHEREALVRSILETTGLADEANKYPAQLSGGQTQRVAVARALATQPQAVFMDEPFGALDMFSRERMQTWLLEVWESNQKTVLFVTHNIEEALFLSDRVLVLSDGELVADLAVPLVRPRSQEAKFEPAFANLKKQVMRSMEKTPMSDSTGDAGYVA